MNDQDKSKAQLIAELEASRHRITELEASSNDSKTLELLLRQSHDELRATYDGMVDGLLIADVETKRFVRVNASICRMLGYSEKELLSRSVMDIHPPEDLPEELERFQAQAEGRLLINEDRSVLRKDGSVFYADIASKRVVYHGRPCLFGVFRDITERKQAQEALRASEERFRVVFEEAPVGMVISVEDGLITRVNRVLCRISGYAPEELVGRYIRDMTHPEDRELNLPMLTKLLAGEISSFSLERRYVGKGGRVFWAQATTAAVRTPDGKLAFVLGIVEDITERRNAQAALERERQTLRRLLQSSDHERQLIAYEIHDGLAQQLAAAIMQLQTSEHLKKRQPANAKTAYEAGVQMLRQAHAEARRLISGVRPPILDESGIAAAIAHLVHDQRGQGPQIEFESRIAFDRLAPLLENAIYRIAQEALTNACKHGHSEKVRVSLVQDKDHVCLEVKDWGIGFDVNAVGEDRFGLEGIKERVRLLGGQMSLESQAGVGTCIRVTLPILEHD